MRTSAKILRTCGRWLTWPGWGYTAPRHYRPWAYLGTPYYYIYRLPTRPAERADPRNAAAPLPRQGG